MQQSQWIFETVNTSKGKCRRVRQSEAPTVAELCLLGARAAVLYSGVLASQSSHCLLGVTWSCTGQWVVYCHLLTGAVHRQPVSSDRRKQHLRTIHTYTYLTGHLPCSRTVITTISFHFRYFCIHFQSLNETCKLYLSQKLEIVPRKLASHGALELLLLNQNV